MIVDDARFAAAPPSPNPLTVVIGILLFLGGLGLYGWGIGVFQERGISAEGLFERTVLFGSAAVVIGVGAGLAARARFIAIIIALAAFAATFTVLSEPINIFNEGFSGYGIVKSIASGVILSVLLGALVPFAVALIGPGRRMARGGGISFVAAVGAVFLTVVTLIAGATYFTGAVVNYESNTETVMLVAVAAGVALGVTMWAAVAGPGWYWLGGCVMLIVMLVTMNSPTLALDLSSEFSSEPLAILVQSTALGSMVFFVAAFFAAAARVLPSGRTASHPDGSATSALAPIAGTTPVTHAHVAPGMVPKAPPGFAQPGTVSPL